ncbi:MAG: cupredoxin domain-containing protein [Elusimicrobia bacterium]|nr:cupredoxin domain-containing protein [Elusimicrobiota bacterium]MDE2236667.1 cupredoxin domain-containing protein [Elusimicrobiota bacterium]MDE2426395.1 cupredoxin domain-containing protein [Elusimicrobiota bacterium]
MNSRKGFLAAAAAAALPFLINAPSAAFSLWGAAKPLPAYSLSIQGRRFVPAALSLPAGVKIKLVVSNKNAAPSEFESFSLHREQVVSPGSETTVFLGPLSAGRYDFFDDFQKGVSGTIQVVAESGRKP